MIIGDRGKRPTVLISIGDFAAREETLHLLRSARSTERLRNAVHDLDAGKDSGERELPE